MTRCTAAAVFSYSEDTCSAQQMLPGASPQGKPRSSALRSWDSIHLPWGWPSKPFRSDQFTVGPLGVHRGVVERTKSLGCLPFPVAVLPLLPAIPTPPSETSREEAH